MTGKHVERGLMMACPHCESVARSRTCKTVTALYRELYYICTNYLCGHTWKAELNFVHTISESACPKPGLGLRKAPLPLPANDRHPAAKPVTLRQGANDVSAEPLGGAPDPMPTNRSTG